MSNLSVEAAFSGHYPFLHCLALLRKFSSIISVTIQAITGYTSTMLRLLCARLHRPCFLHPPCRSCSLGNQFGTPPVDHFQFLHIPFVLVVPKLDCIVNMASPELSREEQNSPPCAGLWVVLSVCLVCSETRVQCWFGFSQASPVSPFPAGMCPASLLLTVLVSCTGYSSPVKKLAFLLRSWVVWIEARPFGVSAIAPVLQNLQICWGCVTDDSTGWKEPWYQSMVINMGWPPRKHIFSEVPHSQIMRAHPSHPLIDT